MEYETITGAAIVIACTTLFGADFAAKIKQNLTVIKKTGIYFSNLAERLTAGEDVAEAIEQCASETNLPQDNIYSLLSRSIRSADTMSLLEAWEKCNAENNFNCKAETKYITQFVSACGNGGADCYIQAAKNVSKAAMEEYEQLSEKSKGDSKLVVYTGACAGVLIAMLLA